MCLFHLERCLFLGELLLVPVGFGPSKQLLGRDFSFRHAGGESGNRKSEKGQEEWDRTRGDQTEKVGRVEEKEEGSEKQNPMYRNHSQTDVRYVEVSKAEIQ